jgi:hypothetical protein
MLNVREFAQIQIELIEAEKEADVEAVLII